MRESSERESLFASRELEYFATVAGLAPRYMGATVDVLREVVREVIQGERCTHGFPDQGECCKVCDPSDPFASTWWENA